MWPKDAKRLDSPSLDKIGASTGGAFFDKDGWDFIGANGGIGL